jgi:hypothetical protein
MAEIMLALGKNDTAPFKDIGEDVIAKTFGVKVLPNELYAFTGRANADSIGFGLMTHYARAHGAQKINIDAKLSTDTEDEISDAVQFIVDSVTHPGLKEQHRRVQRRPDFITANVDLPQTIIEKFLEKSVEIGFIPVIRLTSSRFSEADFVNRGTTAAKNAIWQTRLARQSGFTSGHAIVAASDAEVVKNENPDLILHVTGAILADDPVVEPHRFRHPRFELIESVREFADVISVGNPIFRSDDPRNATIQRQAAARG